MRRHRHLPCLLLSLALALLLPFSIPPLQAQDAPSAADLEALNKVIAQAQAGIRQLNGQRSSAQQELDQAEREIARFNADIRQLQARIAQEKAELQRLGRHRAELETARAAQQKSIAGYLRSAWQNGRQEYLKLLLNQEDLTQSARMLRYYDYFSRARADRIAAYQLLIDEIQTLESSTEASTRRLQANQQSLERQQQALEHQRQARQSLLDDLDVTLSESGTQLANLERQRQDMQSLLEELARSIANLALGDQQVAFAERKGKLPWPLAGPLLNRFGEKHTLGDLSWQGITIAATEGAQLRAVHHGRVIFADWFASAGLLLIIDHGDGYMSLYANNQVLYREVGDWVSSGEIVAAAGDTGGQRQASVYFEIRHDGQPLDPLSWLAKAP
ncbi:MAG: peptidoglycan DD-metalloendopeptidase family protein [Pseudomonadales bacterium]|nr:peptidoglycan DD-metalloendopeptidase family protein [Pseudomonadales bacterium]